MGFKAFTIPNKYKKQRVSYKSNMQQYYNKLYQQTIQKLAPCEQVPCLLSSIFSRTKLPTKTSILPNDRLLRMLDIDKIISINQRTLKQNGDQIRNMRMIASLKSQINININQRTQPIHGIGANLNHQAGDNNLTQINHLVRMARLHFIQVNRRRLNQTDSDDQPDTIVLGSQQS